MVLLSVGSEGSMRDFPLQRRTNQKTSGHFDFIIGLLYGASTSRGSQGDTECRYGALCRRGSI